MSSSLNVKPYSEKYQELADFFDSGNYVLDNFLRNQESLDCSIGKTYVFLTDDEDAIIGFYNIGMSNLDSLESGFRVKIGGAVHINGFALDSKYQGLVQETLSDGTQINLSDFLLLDCMDRIRDIRKDMIGCAFITLSATERGYNLYQRNGFEELEDGMQFSVDFGEKQCISMYYPIGLEEI